MPITLRPADLETDIPRIAELISTVQPEPLTAEMLREDLARLPEAAVRHGVAALDGTERLVGFAWTIRLPWMIAGKWEITTVVDPAMRGQGIGDCLYREALAYAREQGATALATSVRDHEPAWRGFAEKQGFRVDRHLFESTLDLATFDETPFAGVVPAVEATGIRFFTMADVGDTPKTQQKLYDLTRRCAMDVPGSEGTFPPFEEWQKRSEAPWYRADCQYLAADGDRWVSVCGLAHMKETGAFYHNLTGTDRDYRGRQIGLALKLLAIRGARTLGAPYLRTNNDSQNAPMLAINRKLGYQPKPGVYIMKQDLS